MTTTEQQARMIGKAIREEAEIVPTPLANGIERRAFSLKMAIETRGSAFPVTSAAVDDAADVLQAARMYDAFLVGADAQPDQSPAEATP